MVSLEWAVHEAEPELFNQRIPLMRNPHRTIRFSTILISPLQDSTPAYLSNTAINSGHFSRIWTHQKCPTWSIRIVIRLVEPFMAWL